MRLISISLSNLKRRKGRTVFQILGLLVAVAAVVALFGVTTAMRADLEKKIDEFGTNIVVVPKANDLSLSYGGVTLPNPEAKSRYLSEADAKAIRTIKDKESINIVAPKLLGAVRAGKGNVLLVGARLGDELRIKKWWKLRGRAPASADEVIAGANAAAKLGLAPGDSLSLKGRTFRVAAVLRPTGSSEDDLVFADLKKTQSLLGFPGKVSMIEVAAWCTSCPIERIVAQTSYKLPNAKVTAVKQAAAARKTTVDLVTKFSLGIAAAVLAVGALIVFTTTMASVSERTREIGVLRAIGYRQLHIMRVFFFEMILLSVVAGAIGFVAGTAGASLLAPRLAGSAVAVPWDPLVAVAAVLVSYVLGVTASWYPARRASRLDPVEALRSL
ncbi:MAG: FtsX-like permease family protein [Actinobacteria bacterium]|nr:MAG: FtsX-like permease family protein [Actinomycetota bacterium]